MGWIMGTPPRRNKHTLRAQKLDRKAAKVSRRYGIPGAERASRLERKADKAARKGGWF